MTDNLSIEYMHVDYMPFHISENLQILIVIEGSIRLTAVSGSVALDKHDIDVININEPMELQGLSKNNEILLLTINRSFCETYHPNINSITFNCNFDHFYPCKPCEKVKDEFKKQVIEIALDKLSNQRKSDTIDKKLINLLQFMVIKLDDLRLAFQNDNVVHDHFYRFQRITTRMIADSYTKFSLQDIAKEEYLDYHYLSHEFSIKLNTSFYENLHYYRIQNAVRMLLNSELSIRDISVTTGFSATRYFYKMFKKYLNCTPAEFRKKHKNRVHQVTVLHYIDLEETLDNIKSMLQGTDSVDLCKESYGAMPNDIELKDSTITDSIYGDSFKDAIDLINNYMDNASHILTLYDSEDSLFYGGNGLKTYNGLNKPIYYVYNFIKELGDELVIRNDNYIITRDNNSFVILIYNQSPMYTLKRSINLILPTNCYRLSRYLLIQNSHDIKQQWINMGRPETLDKSTVEMLNSNTHPRISYSIINQEEFYLESYLQPYSCELVKLEYIDK